MSEINAFEELLIKNQTTDLLRFATAGNVDDGKSTLIGRLLFDSKSIFEDQLVSIKKYSELNRSQEIDYALVTDGLKAEREQGITIDVAYRYFSTPRRRFIIADTPGHEQYTRNMATGASTASLALILVDAQNGILTQTKRHTFISALLGIRHFVIAINKMDLLDFSEDRFDELVEAYRAFSAKLPIESVQFIPLSALHGDNVTERSLNMPWYQGPPLLDYLESVTIPGGRNLIDFRFPVQYVNWGGSGFRGYCGTIASGVIRIGDSIVVLPSGKKSTIGRIIGPDGDIQYAYAPMAVTICLSEEIDVSRGNMIVREQNRPSVTKRVEANIVWMDESPIELQRHYLMKHTTNSVRVIPSAIKYQFDPDTLHRYQSNGLHLNEIGKVEFELYKPIFADLYSQNRHTGCFVLIDPSSNATVAAGMITKTISADCLDTGNRLVRPGQVFWFSNENRATLAKNYQDMAHKQGAPCLFLDDDVLKSGICHGIQNSDEYLEIIADLCLISIHSGISVIVNTEYYPNNCIKEKIGNENLLIQEKN